MPTIEIKIDQLKKAFRSLSSKNKIKLVEELERETRRTRWDNLVAKIRKRVSKNPISQKEINQICEETRQKLYEKRTKGNN